MEEELKNILVRVLSIPIGLIIAAIILSLKRRSIRDYFGFKLPIKKEAIFWLLWYIPVIAIAEAWYFGFGLNEGRVWEFTVAVMVIRAVGVIILAPVTEELLFRGVMFKAISDSKPGPIGAVILTTVIFTAIHFQYGILDLVTVFIHALFWGWVRYRTGSTFLPVVMHIIANTISVMEFIWINGMV